MYIPLKVTTDYTLLKSLIKIKDLINFCVSKNITSCGICDNNLFGSIEFYKECKKNNIKPIIGIDLNLNNSKVYLYAKDYEGYRNLLKINVILNNRVITKEDLLKFNDNILCIIPYESISIYEELNFYEDIYISYKTKEELKNALIKTDNVVYINDIKVFNNSDLKYLKYLDKLNELEEQVYENNYFNYANLDNFDYEKLKEVSDKLNVIIPFNNRYIPKYKKDTNSYEYLRSLCQKGLYKRLNGNVTKEYSDRLNYELEVINKMGFIDYFLIVYDYVLYAKKNDILVGPGRGSAAGSLVSYTIGITDIDPIKYDLLFERFLNVERVSMPDIDIDFDNTKRDKVIEYVKQKYGKFNVAGGMTYSTLKTRLVLRDIGKLLKVDEILLNKFIKVLNKDLSLKDNLKNEVVKKYLNNYSELKKVYEISLKLEGLKKNISTHAAGIVISSIPLYELIPMYKNEDVYLTGVGMEHLEDLGLLKMDFLALKNLSTIDNIIKKIPGFKLNEIPLNDRLVYELFSNAKTDGIFQFETSAFKNVLTKFKPKNFSELIACIALVRPGPYEELENYIKRKEGLEEVNYYHNNLKDILKDTYGVIIYQEQVISILVKMAGFTYAEADNIRRAMSKKKMNIIESSKNTFIGNSIKNGYDKNLAINIYNHILKFASYGFNKAHSVSYAYISYQMAYLKVHYQVLFTFELLNNSIGSIDVVKNYLNELKKSNLKIYGVSINNSLDNFIIKNNIVIMPFRIIKNLRGDLIKKILEERNSGLFKDIYDFFKRTVKFITKNEYITLINAGVLKEFGINTKMLIINIDSLINYGNLSSELGDYALKPSLEECLDYEEDILRINEINSYGFFISNHPSSKYNSKDIMKLNKIKDNVFKNIVCYVMVENIKNIKTKKNEDMAFLSCSDETDKCDFNVFPKSYYMLQNISKNDMIKVWGTVSKRFDKYSINVNKITKE